MYRVNPYRIPVGLLDGFEVSICLQSCERKQVTKLGLRLLGTDQSIDFLPPKIGHFPLRIHGYPWDGRYMYPTWIVDFRYKCTIVPWIPNGLYVRVWKNINELSGKTVRNDCHSLPKRSRGSGTPQRQGASCVFTMEKIINWINRSLELFHRFTLCSIIWFYSKPFFLFVVSWRCSKKRPSKRWLLLLFGPWNPWTMICISWCWSCVALVVNSIQITSAILEVTLTTQDKAVRWDPQRSVGCWVFIAISCPSAVKWWGLSSVPCGPRLLAFLREHRCAGRQATLIAFWKQSFRLEHQFGCEKIQKTCTIDINLY